MTDAEKIQTLIRCRLEQADEPLSAAAINLAHDFHRSAVNRAYYAMFYAVLALLASRQLETSRHSGAISQFDQLFCQGRGSCRENSRNGCTTDSRIGKRQTTGWSSSTYLWKSSLFSRTLESSSRVYAGICSLAELILKGCATSISCSAGLQACITAAATLMSVLTRARAG